MLLVGKVSHGKVWTESAVIRIPEFSRYGGCNMALSIPRFINYLPFRWQLHPGTTTIGLKKCQTLKLDPNLEN